MKRVQKFSRRYSAQLSFAFLVVLFLMVTVGEGQAYNLQTPTLAAQLVTQQEGFLGKPQIFAGQTVLTGEIQQEVAIIHTVEKGDSLTTIAKRYGLSVGSILDANNIKAADAEKIKLGSELVIPAEDTNTSLAWLETVNKIKEDERKRAEAERQKQLAAQQRNSRLSLGRTGRNAVVYSSSSSYTVVGTMRGSYNGGMPGQCTWYANYARPDLPNGMGNGGQYLANARSRGLATGSTPRAGAIMVTGESRYGHVAYVTSVNGGTVRVKEMNYVGPFIVSERTISANDATIKGYVY